MYVAAAPKFLRRVGNSALNLLPFSYEIICITLFSTGELLKHKWENAFPLDKKAWGYRKNMKLSDVMSIDEILENLVTTVSRGGELYLF